MAWKIPLFKQYWDEQDLEAIGKVIKRGTFWATGPEISEFEERVAAYIGKKHALAFNSGTSALHSVLLAYGIRGREAIVPSFTFIATASAVVLAGGKPVFSEVEGQSYGLDPEDVKERITEKTKAIVPVHYGGGPCREIKALKEIAEDKGILLIEDAAESFGAEINGQKVGSFGDAAMFSLCQNKAITTGEGGLIVTDDRKVFDRMKLIGSHGRLEAGKDYFSSIEEMDYVQVGYNFRMPTMVAALGLSQLAKIEKVTKMRQKNAEYLTKGLSEIKELAVPRPVKGSRHVYQMYTVEVEEGKRNELQQHLAEKGIMSKVYFEPVHLKTAYRKEFNCRQGDLPFTEALSKRVLSLPMYAGLKKEEMDYVIESVEEFFR